MIMKEITEAPFNGKDTCYDDIIDDLTCCDNITKGNTAVGYIGNAPVTFAWNEISMQIHPRWHSDFHEILNAVNASMNRTMKSDERRYFKIECKYHSIFITPYWKAE